LHAIWMIESGSPSQSMPNTSEFVNQNTGGG
jgi:hypothetical protein